MTFLRKLINLLPWVRRAQHRDIEDELRSIKELAGSDRLGNFTVAAEDARSALGWLWIERLGQDLRYALRSMRHHALFTVSGPAGIVSVPSQPALSAMMKWALPFMATDPPAILRKALPPLPPPTRIQLVLLTEPPATFSVPMPPSRPRLTWPAPSRPRRD